MVFVLGRKCAMLLKYSSVCLFLQRIRLRIRRTDHFEFIHREFEELVELGWLKLKPAEG